MAELFLLVGTATPRPTDSLTGHRTADTKKQEGKGADLNHFVRGKCGLGGTALHLLDLNLVAELVRKEDRVGRRFGASSPRLGFLGRILALTRRFAGAPHPPPPHAAGRVVPR